MTVRFFVPLPERTDLPSSVHEYWPWISRSGFDAWGPFSWTFQTFLQLRHHGIPCELVSEMPGDGVVIAHRDFLPDDLHPGDDRLLVCLLADRDEPGFIGRHPWAQFHVVQNPADPRLSRPDPLWPAAYMPYWPQPGLVPRDATRGDRFETAAFFGYPHNLAPELQDQEWAARLQALRLRWDVRLRAQWHDYSDVDVVIAVRTFAPGRSFPGKPPSKLHNAWHAGVPAILGPESAYRESRRDPLDYVEVDSLPATIAALQSLRDNPALRRAMARNGQARATELLPARLAERWHHLIVESLAPAWRRWCELGPRDRTRFITRRANEEREAVRSRAGALYPVRTAPGASPENQP